MAARPVKVNKAFLKNVASRVNEILNERINAELSAISAEYEPSEKYICEIEKINKSLKKQRKLRTVRTVFAVAAVLAMLFVCAMSATAIRRAEYKFSMSFGDDYAVVSYNEVEVNEGASVYKNELTKIETYYEPTYIPAEMNRFENSNNELLYTVIYKNEDSKIFYKQELLEAVTVIDHENDLLINTEINGLPAFYSVDAINNNIYLRWSDDRYLYTISCNSLSVNYEDIEKMAESLSIIK